MEIYGNGCTQTEVRRRTYGDGDGHAAKDVLTWKQTCRGQGTETDVRRWRCDYKCMEIATEVQTDAQKRTYGDGRMEAKILKRTYGDGDGRIGATNAQNAKLGEIGRDKA